LTIVFAACHAKAPQDLYREVAAAINAHASR
jgi:hypothetical protein